MKDIKNTKFFIKIFTIVISVGDIISKKTICWSNMNARFYIKIVPNLLSAGVVFPKKLWDTLNYKYYECEVSYPDCSHRH